MRKLIAKVFNYSLCAFSPTRAPNSGSSAWTRPKIVSPTIRRNSTFSRARTRTSWAAAPTPLLGGVSFWRSLMRLDLIDELQVSMFPYVAGEGTRLFDGVPKSYRLDLVSSTASSNGIDELQYRRHR